MKKDATPEERAAFGAKMKALREAKKGVKATGTPTKQDEEEFDKTDFQETSNEAIIKQLQELQANLQKTNDENSLLRAAFLGGQGQNNQGQQPTYGMTNRGLVGEVEKYLVDPTNYPDPTPRLKDEARLKTIAFNHNYEMDYTVEVVSYENKGINYKEPKFIIRLNRVVLDDQGEQTNKRYIAKRMVFHEDPQAAIVIARENGIDINTDNEKLFLDEMRYLRVKDWLFGVFWPKPADQASHIKEEVIGGTIVQVFTKASEESSSVDFDKLQTKF